MLEYWNSGILGLYQLKKFRIHGKSKEWNEGALTEGLKGFKYGKMQFLYTSWHGKHFQNSFRTQEDRE
jgi:hypothetical protein